ncbi:MAG: hypothetical protein IIC13_17800 [SAR324 cluster bacterium]|nr:hypothetical protein [SAR324 cluster bacterium]
MNDLTASGKGSNPGLLFRRKRRGMNPWKKIHAGEEVAGMAENSVETLWGRAVDKPFAEPPARIR